MIVSQGKFFELFHFPNRVSGVRQMNGTNVFLICLTKEAKVHVGQEKAHCTPMMKDKSSAKYLP